MLEWSVASRNVGEEFIANELVGMDFNNTYSWCMRFDESGKVVEVRAYLDSAMVKQAIEENETHDDAKINEGPVLAS